MSRPPRARYQPILTKGLIWRIIFVATLFVAGAFGMFFWAESRGLAIEEARTLVVNTIVVMEIFYLFSVRYVHGTSLTWQGILGTPAVLIGVGSVAVAQLALTYVPFMNAVFDTRAISFGSGIAVLATGLALLLVVEAEKRLRSSISRAMVARK